MIIKIHNPKLKLKIILMIYLQEPLTFASWLEKE